MNQDKTNKIMYKTVGQNLYYIRKSKGLKQYAFAEEIKDFLDKKYNIKTSYDEKVVSKWERGESIPNLNCLIAICKEYNLSLDELMKDEIQKVTLKSNFEETVLDDSIRNSGIVEQKENIYTKNKTPIEIDYNDYVMVRTTNERIKYVGQYDGDDNLYKATHYRWKANLSKIKIRKYVLSVIGKTIVNVYQVQKWQQAQDRYGEKGVGRIEFVGVEAPSEIKNFFIGKKFLNIYQNPVYYLSDKTILI